jgi:acetyl esterase/lipase
MPDWLRRVTEHRLAAFPVSVTAAMLGGVRVNEVTPRNAIAPENKNRVLINLHSGGFVFGSADDTGVLESAPIASVGRIKVITVEYRRAPEHQFPAASEDVAAVYQELLKKYRPGDIGIFGCSAGGILTAEAIAWFQAHGIRRPGAAGVFGAGATSATRGDSLHLWWYGLQGKADSLPLPPHGTHFMDPYFGDSDIRDAMASPVYWPSVLAKFPPTLVITSTRDVVESDAIHTHAQLVKAGVDTDLHVWEGLGHCFFNYDEDEPESREAYDVIVKFFAKNLGKS